MRIITEPEFKEWLTHPVTIAVRDMLAKKREDIKELLVMGRFTHENPGATAQDTANAIGECSGLQFAATFNFEEYESEIDDGNERERIAPEGSGSADTGGGSERQSG